MNKKALSLAITLAMTIPTLTNALSLGDIESNSSLNQPFRGKINLHSTTAAEAKSLQVRVASQAVFNRVGIDRPAFLNSIRFRTTIQNGHPVILVSSNQPINEPFLNFLLEVDWPNGQLLKEYTVLLDPPALLRPDTAIASNSAGVRAEPRRAQGRITRPVAQSPQQIQQQRVAQQRRQAQAQRQAQQRRVQQQRQAQQARRAAPPTAEQRFNATARRVLANQQARRSVANTVRTYRVRRGDNLSKVAKKLGYRGVRSEQMMVALFEKNRRAFSKNNMNNLKSGALIKRPSLQEARALSTRKSRAQIIAQTREWKNARGVKSTTKVARTTKKNISNNQARLTVAGTQNDAAAMRNASGNSSIAELNKQLSMVNESLSSKQKENEELKSRVTELESLLRKKNRLITLKSEQLARLQAGVNSDAPAEVANTETVVTDEEPVAVEGEGSDLQQQIANELSQDNGEIIRNGEDQLAHPVDETNEAIAESANDEEVVVEEESAFVDDSAASSDTDILGLLSSPTALGIGGGSLLALLGGIWFMRRRKADDGDYEEFSSVDIDNGMDEPQFGDNTAGSSTIDESEFVAHDEDRHEYIKNADETKDNGADDILQEADVYIVYGLHDQAESELKQAIEKEPENMAYRAKLLENYKAAGDVEAFEAEAKIFMEQDSPDKDKYLEEISEWSSALNPESKLFSGLSESSIGATTAAAAGAGVAMVAGTALSEDNVVDVDDSLEDFNLDDILSDDDDDDLIDNIADSSIDMGDFDDEVDDLESDISSGGQFEEISKIDDEIDSIDDFINDDDVNDNLDINDFSFTDELETENESVSKFADDLDNGLDNDLDITNLSLDIDSENFDKIMPEDNAYKSTSSKAQEIDNVDDGFEDNLLADFDDNLSFLDLDDDADMIEETQVDTKLDLAKAYIDMGDIEGARSTLEEVMQDGSEDQKKEAEELLHQTG